LRGPVNCGLLTRHRADSPIRRIYPPILFDKNSLSASLLPRFETITPVSSDTGCTWHITFFGYFFGGRAAGRAGRRPRADTLALAHQLTDNTKFNQAAALLTTYEKTHPASTNAVRLHVQLLYWLHQLPALDDLYARATARQPAAASLQLDYGRILYETRQYARAKAVLGPLLLPEPANVEALTMLGIIAYYEGALTQAAGYLSRVLAAYPGNPTAQAFAQKVAALQATRAPYLRVYTTYRADDQPLRWLETKLEAGSYRSARLSPTVQAVLWHTQDSAGGFRRHMELLAGNKSSFLDQKVTLQLSAGVFKHAARPAPALAGGATRRYQLPKGFDLEMAGSRAPYFFTIASGRAAVLQSLVHGAVLFEHAKGWQGRLQAGETYFAGGNRVLGLSAWGLSRAWALGPVYLEGGYSFAYNDACYNTYAPVLPADQLAAPGPPGAGT